MQLSLEEGQSQDCSILPFTSSRGSEEGGRSLLLVAEWLPHNAQTCATSAPAARGSSGQPLKSHLRPQWSRCPATEQGDDESLSQGGQSLVPSSSMEPTANYKLKR